MTLFLKKPRPQLVIDISDVSYYDIGMEDFLAMIKACIFDLDGTIGNTLDSMVYSVNLTLKEMNLSEISKEQCREFVGNGARVLMEKALDASGNPGATRIEEGMQIYGRIFDENCTYHVTPCEGVPEMLYKLKKKGVKLAVLSNKPHCQAVRAVHAIYGEKLFDWVQGQQEGIPRKPDPAGLNQIMRRLGVLPEETLYLGDSPEDALTAQNAGVEFMGVTWGYRTLGQLRKAGTREWINRPEELAVELRQKTRGNG